VKIGDQTLAADSPDFAKALPAAIKAHGYPASADPAEINHVMTVVMLWLLVVYVTLVYAPIAAWLVELFPSRIRYSGLSLPYHIGNGWFGGFLPATVFAIAACHRKHLFRSVVSGRHRRHEPDRRLPVPAGNQGRRYQDQLIIAAIAARQGDLTQATGRGAIRGRFCFWRVCQRVRLNKPKWVLPDKLQHDLAPMRTGAMLDQIDRLPRPEREFALRTGICSEVAVSMVLTCAGMSSGPSVSWLHPASSGASRSSAVIRSSSTDGSAFSWIVSDAEVWRMNSVTAPSRAPAALTNFAISAVRSRKPRPDV
jgi:hypothetical protein